MKSIRQFLLLSLTLSMALVLGLACLYGYHAGVHEIDEVFDAQLAQYARLLERQQHDEFPKSHSRDVPSVGHSLNQPVGELVGHHYERRIFYQVWRGKSTLLDASDDAKSHQLAPFQEGYHRLTGDDGKPVEAFVLHDPLSDRWIMAAESSGIRQEMVDATLLATFIPILASTVLLLVLVRVFLWRGLAPLTQLASVITSRSSDDFSPVVMHQTPEEVRLLVDNLNQLLARIGKLMERERHFSADLAHELKTPVSAIKLHLANAQAMNADNAIRDALSKAVRSCDTMQAIVEQLLMLYRLEPQRASSSMHSVNLVSVCRDILAQEAAFALERHQSLELSGVFSCVMPGDAGLLGILVRNLVHNAIVYTPSGGNIVVSITQDSAGLAILEVSDDGPGISRDEQVKVFERFYRVGGDRHESSASGSGLGLSIVREIVRLHRGSIGFAPGLDQKGLTVRVSFPVA